MQSMLPLTANWDWGESYTKAAPDVITVERDIDYKCPLHGVDETKAHKHVMTVYPWLPYIGQFVLCLYLPNGESDGFVLGGNLKNGNCRNMGRYRYSAFRGGR